MCVFFFILVSLCLGINVQKRTLVVLDDLSIINTHSSFFDILRNRGYLIDFKTANDESIILEEHGEYLFDNLILIVPESESLSPVLSTKKILDFVNIGNNNVFIASSTELIDTLREVAGECGVDFDTADSLVKDHFSYDENSELGRHDNILTTNYFSSFFPSFMTLAPILFRGLGMNLEKGNHLLIPILTGEKSSFSFDPDDSDVPHAMGQQTSLVTGLQTRKGARVTFVGSLDMFSNRFFDKNVKSHVTGIEGKCGNEDFFSELLKWSFQEKGMLRYREVDIRHPGSDHSESAYRINTPLQYKVTIEEWNGKQWIPFTKNDVAVEFVMLDPYIRKYLDHDGKGHYSTIFQIPDKYGVFKCKVDYRRPGYSILHFEDQVTVRPVRTNEFERYIHAAYPYYVSTMLMIAGFFIFSIAFLYYEEEKVKKD